MLWPYLLAVLILVGCQPVRSQDTSATEAAASGTAPAASASAVEYQFVPESKRKKLLGLEAYNYTDLPISSYSVNYVWGGDVRVSNMTNGGSGTNCCLKVPTVLPAKYRIRWSRDDRRWCELEVTFKGPIPDSPWNFNTHFFEDGHIEISVTDTNTATDMKVRKPSYREGLNRYPDGNVIHDEAFARCKDER